MKLPNIRYQRAVPDLKSSKAAALPNKLRNIGAAVSVVDKTVGTLDKVLENEDKLDANRRLQRARVDYTEDQAALVQEYHTTEKPLTEFNSDMRRLRDRTYTNAKKNASGRSEKMLQGKLDLFESNAAVADVKVLTSLAESRSMMHMERTHQDNLTMVSRNRFDVPAALDVMNESLTSNGLGTTYNQEQRAKQTGAIMLESLRGHLAAGDLASAVKMPGTAAWEDIPQVQRLAMESAIETASTKALDAHTQDTANSLLIGGGDVTALQAELLKIPNMVETETLLEGEAAAKSARGYQGELAFNYFNGQLVQGKYEDVEAELQTDEYNAILSTAQTRSLLSGVATARKASNSTKNIYENVERVGHSNYIKGTITSFKEHPGTPETNYDAAMLRLDALSKTYTDRDKVIPASVIQMQLDLNRAVVDAATTLSIWNDPGAASVHMAAHSGTSDEALRQRGVAEAALESRGTMLGTDPFGFMRELNMPVDTLPPPLSEGYVEGLVARFPQHDALIATFGDDIGGPLQPAELDDLNTLLSRASAEDVASISAVFNDGFGNDNAMRIWNQLSSNSDDMSIMPVAGRLSAEGRPGLATSVMEGDLWLSTKGSSFKPTEMDKVRKQIRTELGGAYGKGSTFYDRNSKAILARYASLTGAPENRSDFSHNKDLVTQAVNDVSGGILDFEGRQYVAPNPTVDNQTFDRWMHSLDADSLPSVAYANGEVLDPATLAEGVNPNWMFTDRFVLVETGAPGEYYISDQRSASKGGAAGGYLFDGVNKTNLAIVKYDPSIIKVMPRSSQTFGTVN